MSFEYNKIISDPKCLLINLFLILLIVMIGVSLEIEKNLIYLLSGVVVLLSPFLFLLPSPMVFVLHLYKKRFDKGLFNKNDQRLVHYILKSRFTLLKSFVFAEYKKNKNSSKSIFWSSDINVIEHECLGVKSIAELSAGLHNAVPAQGSVILNKAKNVDKYLND